jgi:hypothetical protein
VDSAPADGHSTLGYDDIVCRRVTDADSFAFCAAYSAASLNWRLDLDGDFRHANRVSRFAHANSNAHGKQHGDHGDGRANGYTD